MWRITAFDREGREVASVNTEGGEITVGREADRRIVLPSPSVSRRHARIVLDGPQPFIADEGSANGVLVNGVKIVQPTAIVPGVRVDISEYHLEFAKPAAQAAPVIAPTPVAAVGPPPTASLRLVADDGPFAGRAFDVPAGDVAVGRAIDNHFVLDDPSLSRRHCRMRNTGDGGLYLEDLGSSNGTWVNGRRIERGTARIGDALRFGELNFRLEGDLPAAALAASDDDWAPPPPQRNWLLIGGVAAGGVLLVGLVVLALSRPRAAPPPASDTMAHMGEKAAEHLRIGQAKLAAKDFDGAAAESRQAIEMDPASAGDARKLRALAMSEPQNAQLAKQIGIKLGLGGRSDLESAIKLLPELPAESSFREPTVAKVAARLVTFGKTQCGARKYAECAWALCRAYDVVPAGGKPPADAIAVLDDAERKLAKDRTYVRCKKR